LVDAQAPEQQSDMWIPFLVAGHRVIHQMAHRAGTVCVHKEVAIKYNKSCYRIENFFIRDSYV
jgi:hypothetical protein